MQKICTRRVIAIVLTLTLVCSLFISGKSFSVNAADTQTRADDNSTLTNWTTDFGQNVTDTDKAGRIWVDKSVVDKDLTISSEDNQMTAEIKRSDPNNFLVGLSAISSSKSIVGQDTIPIDVMFVLDVSASMAESGSVPALVESTNNAIDKLLKLNINNRIGVVLFSGNHYQGDSKINTATVLLPLDRYNTINSDYIIQTSRDSNEDEDIIYTVSVSQNTTHENGSKVSGSKDVLGGTYIQNGVFQGWQQLSGATNTEIDGTKKIPIMVFMGDGAPTAATTEYSKPDTSNIGKGTSTGDRYVFTNQLTFSWVKNKMKEKYGREPLLYTLGLGLDDIKESQKNAANQVLNPTKHTNDTIDNWWNKFDRLPQKGTMKLGDNRGDPTVTKIDNTISSANRHYVDKFFSASNAGDLGSAFDKIIEEIYIQSLYYPTDVVGNGATLSGYLTFADEIGDLMEVKKIKGLLYNGKLYEGKIIAKEISDNRGSLANNPELAYSIAVRLKIDVSEVNTLIQTAFKDGQIYYNSETDFSSSFKWYSDANNNYLGPYTKTGSASGATHLNESFLISGKYSTEVGENVQINTDLLYITTRITTDLATGKQTLKYMIPAALIPQVKYKVTIKGNSLEQATEANVERMGAYPMRLFYEVGASVTPDNIEFAAGKDRYPYYNSSTDTYTLYSNAWGIDENGKPTAKTVVTLDPSQENEFYYYHKDTKIYADQNGNPATGVKPSQGYYRQEVFKIGQNTEIERHYEEMTENALSRAIYNNEKGYWYIPKGTPRKQNIIDTAEKQTNTTNTANYVSEPKLTTQTGSNDYHIEVKLGNNGLLTMKQNRGDLSVSKEVTGNRGEKDKEFTFTVNITDPKGTPLAGNYTYEKNGIEAGTISNGATVQLKHNDSITINGLPVGANFNIVESDPNTDGSGYTTKVKINEVDVPQGTPDRTATGSVTLNPKTTVHFINDWTVPDAPFSFTKVDGTSQNNAPLAGAEFRLFRLDCTDPGAHQNHSSEYIDLEKLDDESDCWTAVSTTVTSGEDGKVDFKELPTATYRLVEVKSPEGFKLPKGQWNISIDAGEEENTTDDKISIEAVKNYETPAFGKNPDGSYYIQNYKIINPPLTGGQGQFSFTVVSLLCLLVGSVLFIYKKKLN